MKRGAPAKKLVMGMPLYGQAFTLGDKRDTGLNAKSSGKGQAGKYTRAAGFLSYYEICEQVLKEGWTLYRDPELRMGPYAFKDNQWVSFDDVAIIAEKVTIFSRREKHVSFFTGQSVLENIWVRVWSLLIAQISFVSHFLDILIYDRRKFQKKNLRTDFISFLSLFLHFLK